jgi:hypothetical protein
MFWLVIIAMIAGTYYIVQWGKKKAAQQGREDAEREMQARPIQPAAPFTSTSLPPLPPPLPAVPFDLSKGRVTAQLIQEIGRWSESDAANALGVPTKARQPRQGDGYHQDDYAYVDSAGVTHTVALFFTQGRLSSIAAYPQGLNFVEVRQSLGEPIPHPDMAHLDALDPNPAYDYGNMWVHCDPSGGVRLFAVKNASAAAAFLSGASWTTRVP